MEKIYLFDLGGVIMKFDYMKTASIWANYMNKSVSYIAENYKQEENYNKHEKGEINIHQYHKVINEMLKCDMTFDQFLEGWNAIFLGLYPNIENKLLQLSKITPLYALTNTNQTHTNLWSNLYPQLFDIFSKIYTSHDIKARKPEFDCFTYVINDLKIKPNQIKFFDDLQENIEAARNFGFDTYHVTNISEFETELDNILDDISN